MINQDWAAAEVPPPNTYGTGGGTVQHQQFDSYGNPIGVQGTGSNRGTTPADPGTSQSGGGGGGGGVGGLGGSSGGAATPATGSVATPADWAAWTSTGGTTTATGGGLAAAGSGVTAASALSTASSVLPWLQFAASYLESQKSGKFIQPPMSPEQKTMFDWALHYIQTTPDNRAAIDSMLKFDLGHPSSIDIGALKAGKVGYTPQGHMPGVDLAAMIRNNAASNPGALPQGTPPASGYGYNGNDSIADTIRSIQSP